MFAGLLSLFAAFGFGGAVANLTDVISWED